jgi:hypothetical protein
MSKNDWTEVMGQVDRVLHNLIASAPKTSRYVGLFQIGTRISANTNHSTFIPAFSVEILIFFSEFLRKNMHCFLCSLTTSYTLNVTFISFPASSFSENQY